MTKEMCPQNRLKKNRLCRARRASPRGLAILKSSEMGLLRIGEARTRAAAQNNGPRGGGTRKDGGIRRPNLKVSKNEGFSCYILTIVANFPACYRFRFFDNLRDSNFEILSAFINVCCYLFKINYQINSGKKYKLI